MKVVRAAERVIRQNSKEQGVSVSFVNRFVCAEIDSEDVFLLGDSELRTTISCLSFVVSVFHKVRLHHIAHPHIRSFAVRRKSFAASNLLLSRNFN